MAKIYPLAAIAVLFSLLTTSCNKDREAQKPVYLSIPNLTVATNYKEEGTASNKITTVWVTANGNPVGVFELPCTVPALLHEGENDIILYPGINLNGISNTRAIYEAYDPLNFSLNYLPSGRSEADTVVVADSNRTTGYLDRFTIEIVEDFDGSGLNFEKSNRSDTNIRKTGDSLEVFVYPNEDNGNAGVLQVSKSKDLAEVLTSKAYDLPGGGANVYLEMNYRCNVPLIVGLIYELPGEVVQQPVIVLNEKSDWNKVYVNLVSEVSAQSNASGFKLFFAVSYVDGISEGKAFLDNLKLVYP